MAVAAGHCNRCSSATSDSKAAVVVAAGVSTRCRSTPPVKEGDVAAAVRVGTSCSSAPSERKAAVTVAAGPGNCCSPEFGRSQRACSAHSVLAQGQSLSPLCVCVCFKLISKLISKKFKYFGTLLVNNGQIKKAAECRPLCTGYGYG